MKTHTIRRPNIDDTEVRAWIASAWDGLSHRLMLELSDPQSNARAAFHSAVLAIAYSMQEDAFIRTRIDAVLFICCRLRPLRSF